MNSDKQVFEDDEIISRSEIKRQMEALKQLGKRITELRADQQEKVPMDATLRAAIAETRRITSNGALKRHMQYIGKLMRHADIEAIRAALDTFDTASQAHNQKFHALEQWRERLLQPGEAGTTALEAFIQEYPQTDIQQLRQLIRNTRREQEKQQPPTQFRKLFRFLRETAELD
ncbi:putative alpha helix protein [Nitrincola lacisaponensis]|uniref:Dual-action ribosomal maturation protein DarP n=1 Tax=Nitrincola lacisaponensis TaxID=267850 RepID=A0A063Y517_9GAMM|nr:ribosome biogenesis factor YjgA [Nitrincola lacisaponensis]KDE40769.1 putative alpha helix protein [Nitrincola lacisaponensis]